MSLTLQKALPEDKTILENLYSLYLHDLSLYSNSIEVSANGSFIYDDMSMIWNEEGVVPYFIQSGEKLAGFLLLLERPFLKKTSDYSINDIFILNTYRGKGLGQEVLKTLFDQKKGKYFVVELERNKPAVIFWKKVYERLGISYEERKELVDDEPCLIQTFEV
ncbi:GNAT family N-acetyltransferase [Cytobacillus sp. FJAT-54145]|uniref:GNAT family N-acetyltransferase n=1 Tax=Cytobacillus spartinae TaxID=3299023 RepID=A0ABW6KB55_9BACI